MAHGIDWTWRAWRNLRKNNNIAVQFSKDRYSATVPATGSGSTMILTRIKLVQET